MKNAVEQRLEIIESLWNEFAEDEQARLCRWLVEDDEVRMLEAFVEVQNEEGGQVPDLFVKFTELFADPEQYGFSLCEAWRRQYEENREGLAAEEIDSDWHYPKPKEGETGHEAFARCCRSFQEHYQSLVTCLVVVLDPETLTDPASWQRWLYQFLQLDLPGSVRVFVVDMAKAPMLGQLAQELPDRVKTIQPELDMPAAYQELARGDGKGGPGVSFRLNFVALTQAAGAGDMVKLKQCASSALAIAQEHGWPQMQVAVHMSVAAAQLGAKQPQEAIQSYRAAETVASAAAEKGDGAAPKLVMQCKLGEGSALFSEARFREAAPVYEEAAELARQTEDSMMTMESWRMAAYCYEQAKEKEQAYRCGQLALDAAEGLEQEMRAQSTLPYVGQGLLRLLQPKGRVFRRASREDQERTEQVRQRMEQLIGSDWEKLMDQGEQAS